MSEAVSDVDGLPLRDCKKCGQRDTDPRCHVGSWAPVPVGALPIFHMDCHAQLGCPLCLVRIAGADGRTGAELREYLIAHPLSDERVAELLAQPRPDEDAPLRRRTARVLTLLDQLPESYRAEVLTHLKENTDG